MQNIRLYRYVETITPKEGKDVVLAIDFSQKMKDVDIYMRNIGK